MAKKGYLVSAYRSIKDTDKLAAYAKLAGPAFAKYGARYVARGDAAHAYEAGIKQRIVIVEFESARHTCWMTKFTSGADKRPFDWTSRLPRSSPSRSSIAM